MSQARLRPGVSMIAIHLDVIINLARLPSHADVPVAGARNDHLADQEEVVYAVDGYFFGDCRPSVTLAKLAPVLLVPFLIFLRSCQPYCQTTV